MKPIELLNDKLKGKFISRFSVGDTWELCLGDYWLSAQNIISADEQPLNEWLLTNYPPSQKAIDQEYISKCLIVATLMRKEIVSVSLDDTYSLIINFEEDGKLILSTDTDIVDWQWSLSEDGAIPYVNYIVACFWQGEIEINETKIG